MFDIKKKATVEESMNYMIVNCKSQQMVSFAFSQLYSENSLFGLKISVDFGTGVTYKIK